MLVESARYMDAFSENGYLPDYLYAYIIRTHVPIYIILYTIFELIYWNGYTHNIYRVFRKTRYGILIIIILESTTRCRYKCLKSFFILQCFK